MNGNFIIQYTTSKLNNKQKKTPHTNNKKSFLTQVNNRKNQKQPVQRVDNEFNTKSNSSGWTHKKNIHWFRKPKIK